MELFHDDAQADRPEWRLQVYASTPLAIACMPLPGTCMLAPYDA